ncbi:hypothetical protein BJ508DRAFT_334974 [Ascobolus immersus RN42]|uniref:Uncharacterized protein n=1 Tax=Ascobolus immersus RN42 TaxID=1160509 RepID=A0A3N4HHN2_ASCIM|nr:hypothetical protein BJ508DRAFT_334974 [Ascobolus immersus RN42]
MVQPDNVEDRHHVCVVTDRNRFRLDHPDAVWANVVRNMNINLGKQAYNRYHYIPSNAGALWAVPYRLRDNKPCPKFELDGTIIDPPVPNPLPDGACGAPNDRQKVELFTLEQWYALSAWYEFDWEERELDIGECRAHWAVWCGCNGVTGVMVMAS